MTRYEELMLRAERCRDCALKTDGIMASIWMRDYYILKNLARESYILDASNKGSI